MLVAARAAAAGLGGRRSDGQTDGWLEEEEEKKLSCAVQVMGPTPRDRGAGKNGIE